MTSALIAARGAGVDADFTRTASRNVLSVRRGGCRRCLLDVALRWCIVRSAGSVATDFTLRDNLVDLDLAGHVGFVLLPGLLDAHALTRKCGGHVRILDQVVERRCRVFELEKFGRRAATGHDLVVRECTDRRAFAILLQFAVQRSEAAVDAPDQRAVAGCSEQIERPRHRPGISACRTLRGNALSIGGRRGNAA